MAAYDVIVVGAGVEGSATAFYLASRGTKKVLLLEQVRTSYEGQDRVKKNGPGEMRDKVGVVLQPKNQEYKVLRFA